MASLAPWVALVLAGCTDTAADLGQPPPIELATARRVLVLHLRDDLGLSVGERAQLEGEIAALARGDVQAVRARVQVAAATGEGESVRRALLTDGLDPARITVEPALTATRLAPVVILDRSFVHTTPCAAAIGASWRDDPSPSLMSIARCTQSNNLAAMLADPADLIAPPALAPADGAMAAEAVRDWRAQRDAGLPSAGAATSGAGGAGAGSGAGGVPTAGAALGPAAPATAPVVPVAPPVPSAGGGAAAP